MNSLNLLSSSYIEMHNGTSEVVLFRKVSNILFNFLIILCPCIEIIKTVRFVYFIIVFFCCCSCLFFVEYFRAVE